MEKQETKRDMIGHPFKALTENMVIAAKFMVMAKELQELIKQSKQKEMKDLTKILKDGDEVYYTVTGSTHIVKIKKYFLGDEISICNNDEVMAEIDHLNENGSKNEGGECLIFPSKEERNWDNFKRKEEFKRGDLCLFGEEGTRQEIGLYYGYGNDDTYVYSQLAIKNGEIVEGRRFTKCEKIEIADYKQNPITVKWMD